jgi:hypothetical protein
VVEEESSRAYLRAVWDGCLGGVVEEDGHGGKLPLYYDIVSFYVYMEPTKMYNLALGVGIAWRYSHIPNLLYVWAIMQPGCFQEINENSSDQRKYGEYLQATI